MFIYYVYAYVRKDGTPYYIGKGKYKRAYDNAHNVRVPKDKSRIVFLETNLSEIGAFALERRYIRWWGRKDNFTGILHNRTDGGEGACGIIVSNTHKQKLKEANLGKTLSIQTKEKISKALIELSKSEETKQKMSLAKKGIPLSDVNKQKLKEANLGKTLSIQTKEKIRIANTGRKHTEEAKLKMSLATKGKKRKPLSEETKQKIREALVK